MFTANVFVRDRVQRGGSNLLACPERKEDGPLRRQGLVAHVAEEDTAMQSVTVDEIVEKLALPRVDSLKADIEGAERQA